MFSSASKKISKIGGLYKRFGLEGLNLYRKIRSGKEEIVSFVYPGEFTHPIYLRSDSTDFAVFMDVIYGGAYDFPFKFVPQVIIDCGANIGIASIFFKNKYPGVKLIAIEPEDRNFEMLSKNMEGYNDIVLYNNALWNKTARLSIEDTGKGNWGFMVQETGRDDSNAIEAICLKDIMEQNSIEVIDILKIDIEGSEKELFESAYEYWLSRTKVIMIDLHDRMRSGASNSFFSALNGFKYETVVKGQNLFCFLSH